MEIKRLTAGAVITPSGSIPGKVYISENAARKLVLRLNSKDSEGREEFADLYTGAVLTLPTPANLRPVHAQLVVHDLLRMAK